MRQLDGVNNEIPGKHPLFGGRKRKRNPSKLNWRKISIFYELPCWSTSELKHNLDVMHIEKNICDSLLGTILGDLHKSKDTDNARRDLMELGIKPELHLYIDGNRWMKPAAEYTLIDLDRQRFCNFIRSVKFPDGFASNLTKNIDPNRTRITGLKSHDCHIIIQCLLAIGCRAYLNKTISSTVVELCMFFKKLCARSIKISDMVNAQQQLILIICKLERIFPPTFFDIMIHLVIHLPEEAILGGPVYMRWKYPFERYLKKLKDYVRNQSKPEGSITEGYVVEEALTFCSRYFDDVETRFNRAERNEDVAIPSKQLSVFKSQCQPIGKTTSIVLERTTRDQAEFYILNNCHEIEGYITEHKQELMSVGNHNVDQLHRHEFAAWFHAKMYNLHQNNSSEVTPELLAIASRSNHTVKSYPACIVNRVRFLTFDRDIRRTTQNSGVSVTGPTGEMFYGQLQQILELSYVGGFSVVLFRCKWFRCNEKRIVVDNNITSIDISAEAYKDDQFILASQAMQVFYIEDPSCGRNWRVVQEVTHRRVWDVPNTTITEIDLVHTDTSTNFSLFVDIGNVEHINLRRNTGVDVPVTNSVDLHSSPHQATFDASFINDEEVSNNTESTYASEDELGYDSIDEEDDHDLDLVDYDSDQE